MKGSFGLVAVLAIILAAENLEAAPKERVPTVCPSEDSPGETVLLAHESDCSKFYVCFLGEKILKECPYSNSRGDRLHFNPLLQVCDYPSEVGCQLQPIPSKQLTTSKIVPLTKEPTSQLTTPRSIPSSISSSNSSNQIKYIVHECKRNLLYEYIDDKKILKQCPNDWYWNQDLQTCYITDQTESTQERISKIPMSPEFVPCLEEEKIRHECQCNKYYICYKGQLILKSCKEEDDHWNDITKTCTRPRPAKCPYVKCSQGYYKHDENYCNRYYRCEGTIYVPKICPPGFDWGQDDERCIPHDEANCRKCPIGSTKPHDKYCEYYYRCNGKEYIQQACPQGDHWDRLNNVCRRIEEAKCPNNECTDGYYKPHENDCNKYYVCDLSKYVPRSCPPGQHWDRMRKICNEPELAGCGCVTGSTKPHDKYCEYYYRCNGKEYIQQACPQGEHWDRLNNVCRRIEEAKCPNNECTDGYYKPHENDCNKYYVCDLSKYVPRSCPPGQHWDRMRKICNEPELAGCGCVTGSTKPHDKYCEYYYRCNGKEYIQQACPQGEHWDRLNNVCRRIEEAKCPNNECTDGYYKPHENDCNKYYVCDLSKYVPRSCPPGQHWDRKHNVCNEPELAGCGCVTGSTKPHDKYCEYYYRCNGKEYIQQACPQGEHWDRLNNVCRRIEEAKCPNNECTDGYYKPHENDCNKYYVCDLSKYVPRSCPPGQHWDRKHNVCNEPELAGCGCVTGSTKPHDKYCEYYYRCNGKEYIQQACPQGDHWDRFNNVCRRIEEAKCPNNECTDGYYKPHENDCNKYYVCDLSKYVPRSCPPGQHWDRKRNVCNEPELAGCGCVTGSTKPHDKYCEYYYRCNGKDYIQQACPQGEHWDRLNNVCRRIEEAKCPNNECTDGYYRPHENDCNKYYVCDLSKYVPRSCPPGQHWDRKHNVCNEPELAGCGCVTGSTKPHDKYCEYYYRCNGKEYIQQACPQGDHWDRFNNVCRRIEEAKCPNNECTDGYYRPHENDCNKYYVCDLSKYVPRSCPPGQHWDRMRNICNEPELAGCVPVCINGSTKPHECQCEWYYRCISGAWNLEKCLGGLHWNRNTHHCNSPEVALCPTYKCTEGSYKPFPNECNRYYECENNEYVPKTCKSGLHWNNARNICTSVEEANCPYLPKPTCPEGSTSHHECKCELYYQCVKGELVQKKCPNGEEWDRTNKKCDKPEKAKCPHHKDECKEGPYKPHKSDCNKYYKCIGNDYVEKSCPPGQHWDRKHNACNKPELAGCKRVCIEGTKIPHNCYCELYYVCVEGEYVRYQCPQGEQWDRFNKVCRRIEEAKCSDNKCTDGYYKPHENDCNKYYVCDMSKYVPRSCPPGHHWDNQHHICAPPDIAGCKDKCFEGSTKPHECKCYLYYECIGGTYVRKECDAGKVWDSINHHCTSKEEAPCDTSKMSSDCVEDSYNVSKTCDPGLHWNREYNLCIEPVDAFNHTALISTCPEGLFKPHEADCDKVYMCVSNKYIDFKCQPGYHWDRESQRCAVPSEANCPFSRCIDGFRTPHKKFCEKYYHCEDGKKILKNCDEKLHFDRKNGKCRSILKANCPMNKCTVGYYKPHQTECNKYYVCHKSNYIVKTCPPKHYWNPDEKSCEASGKINCQLCKNGDTKPHEIFCEWYYECKDGKFEKTICKDGTHWDRNTQLCRPIQLAACPMNKCNEGLYKPHETECNKYYECEFNNYFLKRCSSGLHWDRDNEVCALPDKAKCPFCTKDETKPHESYCEYYYRCEQGKFEKKKCIDGEQWDRDNEICRTIQLAACPMNKCTQGYYKPHETECDKYYVCKNSEYVKETCKPNLHWDRDDKMCKLPEEVKCNSCTKGDYKPHESFCEMYYECKDGKYIENECSDGNHWDRRKHLCRKIEEAECPENECTKGYYKPHENDCNKYYKCNLSRYVMKSCEPGMYWDPVHNQCTIHKLVKCPFVLCAEGSTRPHACKCNLYYECIGGAYVQKECDAGKVWDSINHHCTSKEEAQCDTSKMSSDCVEDSYNVSKTCDPGLHWNREYNLCMKPLDALNPMALINTCPEGLFKPHETDCNKVYTCVNNKYIVLTCERGYHWNRERQRCTVPSEANCPILSCVEGFTKPHEASCEFFYACTGGKLILNKCPKGMHWDPYNNLCRRIEEANCPQNACANGYYKPHEIYCSSYYECDLSKYVLKICPSGKYWDKKHNVCNLPELAGCTIQSSQARQEHQFGVKT